MDDKLKDTFVPPTLKNEFFLSDKEYMSLAEVFDLVNKDYNIESYSDKEIFEIFIEGLKELDLISQHGNYIYKYKCA
jgi:hypothetical protein